MLTALGACLLAPWAAVAAEAEQRLDRIEQRLETLEREKTELEEALESERISAAEPSLAARLKSVESRMESYRQAARGIEALQGVEVEGGLTLAGQGLTDDDVADKRAELNYRADVTVSLPAGSIGNAEGFLFGHFRMGQGLGLENPGSAFASVNGTSFQRPGSDPADSTVLLAQAWYQLDVPLPLGGHAPLSKAHLELNFGKIDPFVFFDQNAIADDETRRFINQALIHNPLLDVGGDIGVDEFGFTPGFRLAYVNERLSPISFGVSLGVFGTGEGASFQDSLDSPLVIAQAEAQRPLFGGLAGGYRIYAWQNGRGVDLDGSVTSHSGIGLSFDQRLSENLTIFGRIGQQLDGDVVIDRALTLGAEVAGEPWRRGADALGIAVALLRTSAEFRRDSPTLDADGDTVPDFGYAAEDSEQILELYYRFRVNEQFELSPDFQLVRHPGGNPDASTVKTIGLRAQLAF